MKDQEAPSQTALFSAAARAAHPLVDNAPHLMTDQAAEKLCRTTSPSPLDYQLAQPDAELLAAARLSACTRSRYAEAVASEAGADQVVVIGAGLDTLSSRLPAGDRTSVWLVDRPGVLAWRSRLFDEAGVVDAAHGVAADLADGLDLANLEAAGVDLKRPVTVVWLGVSMYLTPRECRQFFADLAGLAEGSALVFDHHLPPQMRDDAGREYSKAVAAMAGHAGEPWQSSPTPDAVRTWLAEQGWRVEADVDEAVVSPEGFFDRQEHLTPMRLVRLVHATR